MERGWAENSSRVCRSRSAEDLVARPDLPKFGSEMRVVVLTGWRKAGVSGNSRLIKIFHFKVKYKRNKAWPLPKGLHNLMKKKMKC